ncbi:MAG TPA: PilZ domain-containing protein [Nitrospirae bacterium]|nr:PilZ domain-containing protein [Nitrospirota bacterium]
MLERCRKICGESPDSCVIESKEQVICIADMVLNKIMGLQGLLDFALEESEVEKIREHLGNAKKLLDDLVEWVRFIQIAHDLKTIYDLSVETKTNERRRFRRYPLPGGYQDLLEITLSGSDAVTRARVINFSKKGMLFISPLPLVVGSVVEGRISIPQVPADRQEYAFMAKVVHCRSVDEGYRVGVELQRFAGADEVDCFKVVYNLIVHYLIHNPQ